MTSKFDDYKASLAHMKGAEKQLFDACAQQAEQSAQSLADYLEAIRRSGRAISQEEYDGLVRLWGDVANQLIFPVSTAVKAVERVRSNRSETGRMPRANLVTRKQMFDAIYAYAADRWKDPETEDGKLARNWRACIIRKLNAEHAHINRWQQLTHGRLKEINLDEAEIRQHILEWKPNT